MPHLVKVQDQYQAQGLIIVAGHCQDVTKDKVCELCRSKHVNYTILSGARVSGDTATGIPHAFLFDASGKCVKEGHPEELVKSIDDLVKTEPHWICRGKKLESAAKAVGEGLKAGKTMGWAVSEVEGLLKKSDTKVQEEATFLKEQLALEGDRALQQATSLEATNAFRAQLAYEEISKSWKKTDAATKADARLKEIKADKPLQVEIAAGKLVVQAEDLMGQLIATNGKINLDYGPNQQTAASIAALQKKLKAKTYADSKCAQKCLATLKDLGF